MKKLSMEELGRISPEEFKEMDKRPVVIVLDNIRSALNVGSIFRTSDAFAIRKICLCGFTAKPPHKEIEKSALGATESVLWEEYATTLECVKQLQEEGYKIIAIEQADGSTMLTEFKFKGETEYAFILGNEVFGVDDEIMEEIDDCIEVPQHGTKHSFNVSVTAGIVLWDYFSKTK
ncbi:MAG: 23S rRNA (guanosine2251-2'-O)-methyltransferase [Sphingobacteriales bacterium]|jgi:23S rRNA (guanosine2251-2'-O)-methyltransferase